MRVRIIQPDYTLKDPLNVKRWMCGKCGLIFDYKFDEEEHGWPEFDPPLYVTFNWQDDEGNYHYEEPERRELCPRCKARFDEIRLIPVLVNEFDFGNFTKTTFVIEDLSHVKVVQEIANCLKRDVLTLEAGNSSNVKSFFALAKSQGKLANSYFLVDGDNQAVDKSLAGEPNFIHLERYCIENYFLDFDICSAIVKKSIRKVKNALLGAITNSSKSLAKGKLAEFLITKLTIDDITKESLAYFDASAFMPKFAQGIGFSSKDEFIETYINYCHRNSKLGRILPPRLVKAIRSAKRKS